jgi:peptidoglycan-associated lipoprotein
MSNRIKIATIAVMITLLVGCAVTSDQMPVTAPATAVIDYSTLFDEPGEIRESDVKVTPVRIELPDVHFDLDSFSILLHERALLVGYSDRIRAIPGVSVVVEGHTDERGTTEYNLALGQRRADAVLYLMKGLGMDLKQFRSLSYGKENPLDPRQTSAAYALNRRVHFVLFIIQEQPVK